MAAPASTEKRVSKKEQDKLRAEQVYKQVALHQSDQEILTLKELFIKFAENEKYSKDDEKVDVQSLTLTHGGLIDVFEYCGIIELKKDAVKKKKLFKHFDLDEDGTIDYDEVLSNMNAIVSGDDSETLHLLFYLFDHDNDGKITKQDLKSLFLFQNQVSMIVTKKKEQEIKLRGKEIDKIVTEMFKTTDKDDSGFIDFDEFKELMKTRSVNKFLIDKQQK
mmetsp:Transcript_25796/g.40949  ORF Transcript_25796/g.40949 Transcript_25796/m.40949 type:complete len:220 (+) Transcript_25796:22-681(+)